MNYVCKYCKLNRVYNAQKFWMVLLIPRKLAIQSAMKYKYFPVILASKCHSKYTV